jgi:hypothetical protein
MNWSCPRDKYGRFLIYGLVDPVTGHLRYVGMASDGLKRPRAHLRWASQFDRYVYRWIRQLVSQGLRYDIVIIQQLDGPEGLSDAEVHWINYFKLMGCPLTNLAPGGEGWRKGMKHRPESKKKIGDANRGKLHSLEQTLAHSRAIGGRPFVDQNGVVYQTTGEFARKFSQSTSNVFAVLKGRQKTIAGMKLKYLEQETIPVPCQES